LRRRGEAEQWTTYDPSAAPWAPTPESDEEAASKDAADDAGGSSPAEAKADAAEHPHKPTTPDAPAAETPLDRDRSTATGGDRELGTVTDSAEKPAAKKAPARKATKKAPAKKATAPPRPDDDGG
jgi:valyl-tRNA synthetase